MDYLEEVLLQRDWENTCKHVLNGIKKLGHDIPITGYTAADIAREMTAERQKAGIKQRELS